MRPFGFSAFVRRLYLAASELHPGVMLLLLLAHMLAGWALLQWAGEADLRPPIDYSY